MKLAKISLAAMAALGAFSSTGFAKPIEEAIKGVDTSGYLRYRYDGDEWENRGGMKNGTPNSEAKHKYRALANLKIPVATGMAFNLGALYINENATANTSGSSTGTGLGAGEDGDFGVSSYFMSFTPEATKTTLKVGKQLLDTPLTDASDFDRGTGIYALSSDIPNWTFAFGAFDTFALADVHKYGSDALPNSSITEAFYVAGAMAKYDALSAGAWYYRVKNLVDSAIYTNLDYEIGLSEGMGLGISLAYARNEVYQKASLWHAGAKRNDLYKAQIDVNVDPIRFAVGYLGNSADGYSVAFDSNAKGLITPMDMGQLWWQNSYTGIRFSPFLGSGIKVEGNQRDALSVLYANFAWDITDSVRVSLIGVGGKAELDRGSGIPKYTREFIEITPMAEYKHTENLSFLAHHAMLQTKVARISLKEYRNRFRFQALYRF